MNANLGLASLAGFAALFATACSSNDSSATSADAGGTGGANGVMAGGGGGATANGSGGTHATGTGGTTHGSGGTASTPSTTDSGTDNTTDAGPSSTPTDGGAPTGFWDTSPIPQAKNVMIFRFLNRTNGKYQDSEVYWSFKSGSISELHSVADQDTYDMPANSAGRLYVYLCAAGDTDCASGPTKSKYYDFIEHTIGTGRNLRPGQGRLCAARFGQPRRPRTSPRRAAHRNVAELLAVARRAQHQSAAAHVSTPDELRRK